MEPSRSKLAMMEPNTPERTRPLLSRPVSVITITMTGTCLLMAACNMLQLGSLIYLVGDATSSHQNQQQIADNKQMFASEIKDWANRLGSDIHEGSSRATCVRSIRDAYLERGAQVVPIDPIKMHTDMLQQINEVMLSHRKAVESIARAAELLAANHTFVKGLHFDYIDVHRLRGLDEPHFPTDFSQLAEEARHATLAAHHPGQTTGLTKQLSTTTTTINISELQASIMLQQQLANNPLVNDPSSSAGFNQQTPSQYPASSNGGSPVPGPPEWQTPFRYLNLTKHKNFPDILVNLSESAVHLPVPVYPGQQEIMNGIAWSQNLTKVFRDNMMKNPRLTNQYFASYLGFLRTYPAHKWRIARSEPDLYDARMRPWYTAGAASPKDLVILVDSSGSMTGLRREIAKGVVFEILDTLTDNDYFSILKFSETVTPIGLPRCDGLKPPKLGVSIARQCSAMSQAPTMDNKQKLICNNYKEQRQRQVLYRQQQLKLLKAKQHQQMLLQHQQQLLAKQNSKSILAGTGGQSAPSGASGGGASGAGNGPATRQLEAADMVLDQATLSAIDDNITASLTDELNMLNYDNQQFAYSSTIVNVTNELEAALMLPATGRNIRHIKGNFSMTTTGIANFTHALIAAFELLQSYNRTGDLGSQCNQAIMLITDGAPDENFMDTFNRYNYPDRPIRLFSYVIGREVGDIQPTKLMACNNRGYYTHVINLSEVREQVQQYLPVMSRPLVLWNKHPVVWTAAYGDETYQLLSDWVWENKRRERAKIILSEERDRLNSEASNETFVVINFTGIREYDEIPQVDEELKTRFVCEDKLDDLPPDDEFDTLGYNDMDCHWQTKRADLLTSVVQPVINTNNKTLVFERVLQKNIWVERDKMVYNAQLLGMASVDISINQLMAMAPTHKLGPNAYPILITNNGYIMSHPNLRALLEDPTDRQSRILKPFFASVDFSHVELTVREGPDRERPYEFSRRMLALREAVVKRLTGYDSFMTKRPIDCQKRAQTRNQSFYYGPIKDTPFTFLISLPQPYGMYRVNGQLEFKRPDIVEELPKPLSGYFKPSEYDIWTVHPDYNYCDSASLNDVTSSKSVRTILSVLEKLELKKYDDIQWRHSLSHLPLQVPPNKLICDKDLLQSLMFDAVVTYDKPDSICGAPTAIASAATTTSTTITTSGGFTKDCDIVNEPAGFFESITYGGGAGAHQQANSNQQTCRMSPANMRHRLISMYGIELSFIATRSGLTRVRVYDLTKRIKRLAEIFIEKHSRALDETFYGRTVDYNLLINDTATVITVPYNAYVRLIAKLRMRATLLNLRGERNSKEHCEDFSHDVARNEKGINGNNFTDTTTSSELSGVDGSSASLLMSNNINVVDGEPIIAISADDNDNQQLAATEHLSNNAASNNNGDSYNNNADGNNKQEQDKQQQQQQQQQQMGEQRYDESRYRNYSAFQLLDLLYNSSVHVSATQSIVIGEGQQRSVAAVTGLLYDYATFAKRFFNTTSMRIISLPFGSSSTANDYQQQTATICHNEDGYNTCPSQCGYRNDSVHCFLIDNNGFVVVSEELNHIGRHLAEIDSKLLASLVADGLYHPVDFYDYQAVCIKPEEKSSSSSAISMAKSVSLMSLQFLFSLMQNLIGSISWMGSTMTTLISIHYGITESALDLLGLQHQLVRGAADAQSTQAQALLSILPNKTTIKPCEKEYTLFETRPTGSLLQDNHKLHRYQHMTKQQQQIYLQQQQQQQQHQQQYQQQSNNGGKFKEQSVVTYTTHCECDHWYVYDRVPKTNLIMLIMKSDPLCSRGHIPFCDLSPEGRSNVPNPIRSRQYTNDSADPRDTICVRLEREANLYRRKLDTCISYHSNENKIEVCGSAFKSAVINKILLMTIVFSHLFISHYLMLNQQQT